MSFSGDVKAELCQGSLSRACCARAEAYGALLCCNTFTPREVRVITECESFARRLPELLDRAFGLAFDRLPGEGERKYVFQLTDAGKISRIIDAFGFDSTSAFWRRTAAAPPFCGGPFWRGAASRSPASATTWSWRPATPRPAGS